jgi:hypothetical protein
MAGPDGGQLSYCKAGRVERRTVEEGHGEWRVESGEEEWQKSKESGGCEDFK